MNLQLFFHPFSSYSQKALIALYENATPFTARTLSPQDPATGAEFAARRDTPAKAGLRRLARARGA